MAKPIPTSRKPSTLSGVNNILSTIISSKINEINTCLPGKVVKVSTSPLAVDLELIVLDVDPDGKALEPITIINVPVVKQQCGKFGIIMEPQADDTGIVIFSKKDISRFKKEFKKAPTNSMRMFDLSDGIYIGMVSKEKPETFVELAEKKITIKSGSNQTIEMTDKDVKIKSGSNQTIEMTDKEVKISGGSQSYVKLDSSKAVLHGGSADIGGVVDEIVQNLITMSANPCAPGAPVWAAGAAQWPITKAKLSGLKE